jgi:hypothetical protein
VVVSLLSVSFFDKEGPVMGKTVRTMNAIITKKVNAWLETIEDEALRKACERDVIVTGGSIASMLLGEEVNDYDLYFKKYDTVVSLANYYLSKFQDGRTARQGGVPYEITVEELRDTLDRKRVRMVVKSAGIAGEDQEQDYNYFESQNDTPGAVDYVTEAYGNVDPEVRPEKPDYHPVFLSSNAITLKGDIQLILRFFGGPDAIHENFDFVHCMNYWTPQDGVVLNPEALESLLTKNLRYKGSLYPVCSVFRSRKFIERGWKINAGQYLKMILQISELNLKDFAVLEEQLTGVDVAYFNEVLSKAKQEGSDTIETAYLIAIIDRMF